MTVNVQVGPAPLVEVTVVVPTGKNEPEAGELVTGPQIPLMVGPAKLTTAPHWFGSFGTVILDGHVIEQGLLQHAKPLVTRTVSMFWPLPLTLQSDARRKRNLIFWPAATAGRLTVVVIKPPELPLQA